MKRIASIILALVMIMGLNATSVFASTSEYEPNYEGMVAFSFDYQGETVTVKTSASDPMLNYTQAELEAHMAALEARRAEAVLNCDTHNNSKLRCSKGEYCTVDTYQRHTCSAYGPYQIKEREVKSYYIKGMLHYTVYERTCYANTCQFVEDHVVYWLNV